MGYQVSDISNKIILRTDSEQGDIISNLKLQKMLYYMQGYHLAFFDKTLFDEDLEAWAYGPVVPNEYRRFKSCGSQAIQLDKDSVPEVELEPEVEDMFTQVMTEYGKFGAIKLMEMTHREQPWKEAFENNTHNHSINIETMKLFFKKMISE